MNYFQYTFVVNPPEPGSDILISLIADLGFESFENSDTGFIAYIQEEFTAGLELNEIKFDDFSFSYSSQKIDRVNWNEEWEKNFEPVIVSDSCCIRAPFHQLDKSYPYDIIIMPKMSFGTGHHDTTWLVCKNMLDFDLKNKSVFDMGSGTGVLAILAHKLGAKPIIANDIDNWSVENAKENFSYNNCKEIEIVEGNGNLLATENKYDFIFANINKNILKSYLPSLSAALKNEGFIFLSGFFKTDCEELINLASENSLSLYKEEVKNEWATLILKKK